MCPWRVATLTALWNQRYEPVANNLALSVLVAALPVIVLLGSLGLFRVRAHYAALAGLATAFLVALPVYGMPAPMATAALANGALFGLFPIGWIVLTAMFVYDLTVKTGQFELAKDSIAGMASDRRIQVLLIAFCFGAFVEGSTGFGTPVAMPPRPHPATRTRRGRSACWPCSPSSMPTSTSALPASASGMRSCSRATCSRVVGRWVGSGWCAPLWRWPTRTGSRPSAPRPPSSPVDRSPPRARSSTGR